MGGVGRVSVDIREGACEPNVGGVGEGMRSLRIWERGVREVRVNIFFM